MILRLVLVASLAGCPSGEWESPRDCATISEVGARDRCWHEAIRATPAERVGDVADAAARIEDPLIRAAAVVGWIADHAGHVDPARGRDLCNMLGGRDRAQCMRRLQTPHLQR